MSIHTNKKIITEYIDTLWNQNKLDTLDQFLDDHFEDHSLPNPFPPNKEGLKLWVISTGKSFEHQTIIEDIVAERNKVIIKIRMNMKHIGTWRNIEPTGATVSIIGYRNFTLKNNKIVAHWALIDGNSIENQLKDAAAGCKIQA
jgi:predicted ester cyclase